MTGLVGGVLYIWASDALIAMKLDDVVDAVPVHFVNGVWGCLVVGLLSEPERLRQAYGTDLYPGFFYSLERGQPDARLLGCQVIGMLFIAGWTTATMLPFFLGLNYCGWLRSDAVEELVGLDVCYNGEDIAVAGTDSKNGSDGQSIIREEYLDAYEDYRKQQQRRIKKVGMQDDSHRSHSQQKVGMQDDSDRSHSQQTEQREEAYSPRQGTEPGYTDDSASVTDSLEPAASPVHFQKEIYYDEISL